MNSQLDEGTGTGDGINILFQEETGTKNVPSEIDDAIAEQAITISIQEAIRIHRVYGANWEQITAYEDGYTYYKLANYQTGGTWFATIGRYDRNDLTDG